MKRLFFTGLLLASGVYGLGQEIVFSLEQALARIGRAPEVLSAQQKLRQAEADLRVAQGQAGLQIGLGGGTSYAWATANPAAIGTSLSLSLSLPLGSASAPIVAVRQAELNVEAARSSLRQMGSDLVRRVVQAYAQVLLAQSQRKQSGLWLELAKRQSAVVEAQQDLGAATPTQVLNARLAASTAQQNVNRAEGDLRDRQAALAALLGLVTLPGSLAAPLELPSLPSLEQLLSRTDQSPAVLQAMVALEQAQLAVRKAGGQPGFSLSLGFASDQLEANLGLSIPDYSAQAGLTFRPTLTAAGQGNTVSLGAIIPLFDGGSAEATRQGAALGLEFAQAGLSQTRRDTQRLLQGALEQALLDQQNLMVQTEAAMVAEKSLAEVRQRLAAGAVTALDELAARAALEAAEGTWLAARMRILEDLYQLYALLGVERL
jgi:outer membrane protein